MAHELEIRGRSEPRFDEALNPEALALVAELAAELGPRREELLERRVQRQRDISAGMLPSFRADTADIRAADWRVPPAPPDLADRRVEITGPTDARMIINALRSGAKVFMADLEDANTPTWTNMVGGQVNLRDAARRTLAFDAPDGRRYRLEGELATLLVRPRGWHLDESHAVLGDTAVPAGLFDAGVFLANNARELLDAGSGPYLYLAKMESSEEAALWHQAFLLAEDRLGLPRGSIRATVLIETVLGAFEIDEILHELGEHASGCNAGRWDYIFSIIKKFRDRPDAVLPDRAQVTMTVPFMRAYTELLVKTCHRRGAHAIGGMAAFIPSRRDPEVNERALAQVRADKMRESGDGFDGTWVAHPDLVAVATEVFDGVLGGRANQLDRQRPDVVANAAAMADFRVPGSSVTEAGLRNDVAVGLRYLESWLRGTGAVAVFNLMEDVATAEIARCQIWQWCRHGSGLEDGRSVTPELVRVIEAEELVKLRDDLRGAGLGDGRSGEAAELFERVALGTELAEFLTAPGQAYLQ